MRWISGFCGFLFVGEGRNELMYAFREQRLIIPLYHGDPDGYPVYLVIYKRPGLYKYILNCNR
jgi:hypothetical protein